MHMRIKQFIHYPLFIIFENNQFFGFVLYFSLNGTNGKVAHKFHESSDKINIQNPVLLYFLKEHGLDHIFPSLISSKGQDCKADYTNQRRPDSWIWLCSMQHIYEVKYSCYLQKSFL